RRALCTFSAYTTLFRSARVRNLDSWSDQGAATALMYAVRKNVDNVIITPSVSSLPPFMSKWYYSMIFQFKSYAFAFYNQGLVAGSEEHTSELQSRENIV